MKFMICDKDAYHEIPTPAHNLYEDKYVAIMQNSGLKAGVWYPCRLLQTLPCPDMSVWAFDIQPLNILKYIRVLKSEIDNGYVKLDFEEDDE